ncbi:MAG TPA: sodium:proton antiporter [Aliidongia sp.]|nr:sodium:proton antiporter [Aliidongia sp.]
MDIHILTILSVAMVIAIAARRLHLPYTVGLVAVGIVLSFSRFGFGITLTHDFIFQIILPPLLFESALSLHWRELRADLLPILTLSTVGTVIGAIAVATGMVLLLHWPTAPALVFGILIAATDPVAVVATFKDNGVKGRLRLLIESESLFNDGVAAVLFTALLAWAESGNALPDFAPTLAGLALTIAGGIAVGLLSGAVALGIAGRTADQLVETVLTLVAAYGSFSIAEHLGVSGVLATVSAGLLMGSYARIWQGNILNLKGGDFTLSFWEFAAFLANSIVFPLIGTSIAQRPFAAFGTVPLLITLALVPLGRALTVYPLSLLFHGSRRAIPLRHQHVLWWGGLRGAMGLALALSLPDSLPYRDQIVIATFAAVAFSILLQGITMPLLLQHLGFLKR